jgi:type VI secretion system protein ImpM
MRWRSSNAPSGCDPALFAMTLEAGWYGKIPSLGDFASRRLPSGFIATWDSWLQHSMATSRVVLGEQWLECYLTSPLWRFALMPGVVDAGGASAWAGLLMPSVDRVGRHFPLTLALELLPADCPDPVATTLAAQRWYGDLERVALAALDVDFTAEDLERELAALPFPLAPAQGDGARAIDDLARWWQGPGSDPLCLDLPSVASLRNTLAATASRIFAGAGDRRSLWWAETQGTGLTQLHCLAGLPPEDYFSTLLQGSDPLP